jgi:hippurate hydrolase
MFSPAKAIQAFHAELTAIRRDIHAHPEFGFQEHRTAALVIERLKAYGVDEVHTGIGKTGVVGVIRGKKTDSNRGVGLRADMDCLKMTEENGFAHISKNIGYMHACGHDGHTTMLLGAAKYLASTRAFNGTVYCIFQPAEEGHAGGDAMVKDGLFTRFKIDEVYALHNFPDIEEGKIGLRPGPIMASSDTLRIQIEGKGGHGGLPHNAIDPVLVAGHVLTALQSIVARNVKPVDTAVISICAMQAGVMETTNVIPRSVELVGTVRAFTPQVQDQLEARLKALVPAIAEGFGAKATVSYDRKYPPTINTAKEAAFAAEVAREVFGADNVDANTEPTMGAEDFSFMLQQRPGCYLFIGNGGASCGAFLHNTKYDFNDSIIPNGAGFLSRLAERAMPLE